MALNASAQDAAEALWMVMKDGVTNVMLLDGLELTYSHDNSKLTLNDYREVPTSLIEQMSFGAMPKHLTITYDGAKATAINPYFIDSLDVVISGADVTVSNLNTYTELTTQLEGTSGNGSLTYNGTYKTTIVLNGVNLTSSKGAAIDIQCGKRVNLEVKKGTENFLTDSKGGSQKAALYCKGHLELDKAGSLTVTGNTAHAIAAKEYIKLKKSDGTINILGAVKDAFHCKQYMLCNGWNVNISGVVGDGVDVELDGEENEDGYADGSLHINGGAWNIKSSADTIKAFSADTDINISAGTFDISMTGKASKGLRAGNNIIIGNAEDGSGPVMNVTTTGAQYSSGSTSGSGSTGGWGGRPGGGGWGGGGGPGGNSNTSSSKAIKALNQITVYGGNLTISTATSGAEGMEGKQGVTIAGGSHYMKCYDDCINSGGIVKFTGGTTVCWATGNDAVDSNYGRSGAITIAGGNVFAYTTKGSPEEGFDCDNNSYITVTGGIAVSAGGSQGGGGGGWGGSSSSSSIGSSTQGYYLGSSPSSYNSTYYYTLCATDGTPICTYKFGSSVSNTLSLLTAPNLGKGSVTVKYGSSKPTEFSESAGDVFFINPTVTTSGTTATVTAK